MKKIINFITRKADGLMAVFALTFAIVSTEQFCFYIFHQPEMPEEIIHFNKK